MEMKNIGIVKEILGIVENSLIPCSGQIALQTENTLTLPVHSQTDRV